MPPKMRFITPMWHPNSTIVFPTSRVLSTACPEQAAFHSLCRWTRLYLYSREHLNPLIPLDDRQLSFLRVSSTTLARINGALKMPVNGGCQCTLSNQS